MGDEITVMESNPKTNQDVATWQPIYIKTIGSYRRVLKKHGFFNTQIKIVNETAGQLEELFCLRNPQTRFLGGFEKAQSTFAKQHLKTTRWFYFPWLNKLVAFLPEALHTELRTGRNRNLITNEEQKQFYNSHIAILGMSVGSHVALTIVLTGGGKYLTLADPDTISGSNINRIRTGFHNVGLNKTKAVARQVYEINPYAKINIFPEGLNDSNLKAFFKLKCDLVIEETDLPYLKIKVRELARPLGIPVIMAADNADGVIADVERFDQNKKLPILHGLIGNMSAAEYKNISPQQLPKTMAKIAGANLSTVRMLESVMQVGKSIYSWPQLGNAATLCGSILAFIARSVILGKSIKSGRTNFSPQDVFLPATVTEIKNRNKFLKMLGL